VVIILSEQKNKQCLFKANKIMMGGLGH
jgi:hypothetical protein